MADLRVENLKIRLGGNEILKGVSLELKRGEVTALLGPSGSGKTTLLRAVAGLEQPYDGRIEVAGKTMFDGAQGLNRATEARGLGFVFQSYALWPHRTVAQNVAYSLVLRGQDQASRDQRVKSALESLGLGHLGHRYPHELSGGQCQRVMIAMALVLRPALIIADEPTSALDTLTQSRIVALLRELREETGSALLLVSHDLGVVASLCTRVLVLHDGRLVEDAPTARLLAAPAHPVSAALGRAVPRLAGAS